MSTVRDLSLVVSGLLFLHIVQDYFTQSNAIKTIDKSAFVQSASDLVDHSPSFRLFPFRVMHLHQPLNIS